MLSDLSTLGLLKNKHAQTVRRPNYKNKNTFRIARIRSVRSRNAGRVAAGARVASPHIGCIFVDIVALRRGRAWFICCFRGLIRKQKYMQILVAWMILQLLWGWGRGHTVGCQLRKRKQPPSIDLRSMVMRLQSVHCMSSPPRRARDHGRHRRGHRGSGGRAPRRYGCRMLRGS
eukprot:gene12-biopygen106